MRKRAALGNIVIAACLLLAACTPPVVSQKNVVYGEREKISFRNPETLRIYFDREGSVYPEYFIDDAGLKKAGASLKNWYLEHPSDFSAIAHKYQLADDKPAESNFLRLQDSLLMNYKRRVEQESATYDDVVVLVHGFRKSFFDQDNGDYTSVRDYDTLRKRISSFATKKHYFIEIYWDAMYDRFSAKNVRNNKAILQLFENEANVNAVKTGYELRRLLTSLQTESLKIISHSLGARVVTTALFNTDTSEKRYSTELAFRTPGEKTDVCLIAPAIGGTEVFNFYYQRNTGTDYRSKDNYRLMLVYNEKDYVLCKKDPKFLKLGPGPQKYGITTLGCNHNGEVEQVKELFKRNYPGSEIRTLDFTGIGNHHHLRNYVGYSHFNELVSFLESEGH